ncbi:MAG: helix-turn-helix domain-containing protein [Acidobacteriota bacterium]|nr:helix-turn-helix domain-containing protein [Acidobacteriota bacterium]
MVSKNQNRPPRGQAKSKSKKWPEKMKVSQARQFLGVSPAKMTALLTKGVIPYLTDPFDLRVKLIKRSDLEALLSGRKQD